MVLVESEFDPMTKKDHVYVINKLAQRIADKIEKKHELPERIVIKVSAREQQADAYISYEDWKIVIDYNSMNIQKELIEQRALEGLLAHEIMHIAQKIDGTEETIIKLFTKEFKARGFGEDMFEMMKSLGMIVKDVFVNDALVDEGFSDQLLKHYSIVIHSRVRENVLPFGELSGHALENFFIALVGLFPSYASFYRKEDKIRGELIKKGIKWHFDDFPREIRVHIEGTEAALLQLSLTEKGINEFIDEVLICYSKLLSY